MNGADPGHIRMSPSKHIDVELYNLALLGFFFLGEEGANIDASVRPVKGNGF